MRCLFTFTDKLKKKAVSAPELRNPNHGDGGSNVSKNRVPRSANAGSSSRSISDLHKEKAQNLRVFTYSELREATNDFSRILRVGEGGFGTVYKGKIKPTTGTSRGDSVDVAIKKLNKHGMQGHKEWLAEVHFLGVADHPNLVKLVGYCSLDDERGIQRLLVYEYMPNKSLEHHLFDRTVPALSWVTRLKIMLGAAQGMAYLHQGLEIQVIFRDFKTSNILLDDNFNPKLSDFGMAREGPQGDHTHVSTVAVGTYGYAAPEYVDTGHLNMKCDMYSFGVVLYEILTGRRVIERNRPKGEQRLLDWIKDYPVNSKRFYKIIDPRLHGQYATSAAQKIAKLADRCLSKNAKDRPDMNTIIEVLKKAVLESEGNPFGKRQFFVGSKS